MISQAEKLLLNLLNDFILYIFIYHLIVHYLKPLIVQPSNCDILGYPSIYLYIYIYIITNSRNFDFLLTVPHCAMWLYHLMTWSHLKIPKIKHLKYESNNCKSNDPKPANTKSATTIASQGMINRRRKWDDHIDHHLEKKKYQRNTKHGSEKRRSPLEQRSKFTNFTPLMMLVDQVLR